MRSLYLLLVLVDQQVHATIRILDKGENKKIYVEKKYS